MPGPSNNARLRVNQLGVEALGQWNGSGNLRVNQLGLEVLGAWTGGGLLRVNQLGAEVLGGYKLPPSTSRVRVNQLGAEFVRSLVLPAPAGDTTGHEYYVGPGFQNGEVPEKQPATYEPLWGPVQALTALGTLEGVEVTIQAGTVTNVPITGSTALQVTFPSAFNEACYFVAAVYIPQNGDSSNIYVYGNPYPSNTQPSPTGFELLGQIVAGSTPNTTGAFAYVAVGL